MHFLLHERDFIAIIIHQHAGLSMTVNIDRQENNNFYETQPWSGAFG